MTKLEYGKCEKLMEEAIRQEKKAIEEFSKANEMNGKDTFELLRLQVKNHLGYAEGIYQALSIIGFKHDRMKELSELL